MGKITTNGEQMGKIISAHYLVRKKRRRWHKSAVGIPRYQDNVQHIFGTKSGAQQCDKLLTLTFSALKEKFIKSGQYFNSKWSQQ